MSKKLVLGICLLIFLAIMGFDATLYIDKVPGNSISQIIAGLGKNYPIVPWFVGLFMGFLGAHFFDTTNQGDNLNK